MTNREEIREHFEANMLDGQDIDDCGKAILDAKYVLEYIQEYYSLQEPTEERDEFDHLGCDHATGLCFQE